MIRFWRNSALFIKTQQKRECVNDVFFSMTTSIWLVQFLSTTAVWILFIESLISLGFYCMCLLLFLLEFLIMAWVLRGSGLIKCIVIIVFFIKILFPNVRVQLTMFMWDLVWIYSKYCCTPFNLLWFSNAYITYIIIRWHIT